MQLWVRQPTAADLKIREKSRTLPWIIPAGTWWPAGYFYPEFYVRSVKVVVALSGVPQPYWLPACLPPQKKLPLLFKLIFAMKNLILMLCVAVTLGSCSVQNRLNDATAEKFTATPISMEEAAKLQADFAADTKMQRSFKKGMMIPAGVLKAILETGVDEVNVFYGKDPQYITPVFIVYGSVTGRKPAGAAEQPFDKVVYKVYYPCPTNCVP
ncbi:MAG: hypothetical protein LCH51_16710 [Bacteroidetes bacterium]|nr:hypothetical protein [Bacteroidota bacterium]HOA38596.1 hypothetical protein [Flavihumibacter sp.]